ncbi:hypothetical protein KVH31_13615 [Streptomyces olivaceus]|uniref:hypothetical protein n=1 Tax=Streptomyces olivaceus TaxID=47716 RepID=UPI001CCAF5E8|nr:hypothetical protein [Streptomyces olivaceus]MBZ6207537.1 hypothetical protein [Streptomyces olivaceus]
MDTGQAANQAQQQSERQRAHEQRTIAAATQALAQALADAQNSALTRWIRETVTRRIPEKLAEFTAWVRALIGRAFTGKARQAQTVAEHAAHTAAQDSAQHAAGIAAALRGQPTPPVQAQPGDDALTAAASIPAAVDEEHGHALALLTTAGLTAMGLAGLTAAFTRARRAIGRIARATATAIGAAAAHAAQLVAHAIGPDIRLLWVAELDACPACAAYSGHHIRRGGRFPGDLTLDPRRRAVFPTAIPGPPRHPHCRCVLIPWSPAWPATGTPLPTLLRQRARTARRT